MSESFTKEDVAYIIQHAMTFVGTGDEGEYTFDEAIQNDEMWSREPEMSLLVDDNGYSIGNVYFNQKGEPILCFPTVDDDEEEAFMQESPMNPEKHFLQPVSRHFPYQGYDFYSTKKPLPIQLTAKEKDQLEEAEKKHEEVKLKFLKERDEILRQLQLVQARIEQHEKEGPQTNPKNFSYKDGKSVTVAVIDITNLQPYRNRGINLIFTYPGPKDQDLESSVLEKLRDFYKKDPRFSRVELSGVFSRTFYESDGKHVFLKTVKDPYSEYTVKNTRSVRMKQIPDNVPLDYKVDDEEEEDEKKGKSCLDKLQQDRHLFSIDQLLDVKEFPNTIEASRFENQLFRFQKDFEGGDDERLPPTLV